MNRSKLTTKHQASIPKEIRKTLGIKAGDTIVFELLSNNQVVIRKARPFDQEFARALMPLMSEWSSQNDEEDYGDL